MMNDITSDELRAALAESFPERSRREHDRAARIMAAELEAITTIRVPLKQYMIRTDAVMQEIEAPNMDDAAMQFARGEGIRGVVGAQSLIEAYARIGDGAWVWIEGDGCRYGFSPNGEWFRELEALQRADDAQTAGQA